MTMMIISIHIFNASFGGEVLKKKSNGTQRNHVSQIKNKNRHYKNINGIHERDVKLWFQNFHIMV